MKYLLFFLLFLLCVSALAVTPTTVTSDFLVINNIDEKADYIVKSGNYEQRFELSPNEKIKLNLTDDFSEEIYIYEIQDIQGLGIANSIKITVDKESDSRLNLGALKIGNDYSWLWTLLVIPIATVYIFRKKLKKTLKTIFSF